MARGAALLREKAEKIVTLHKIRKADYKKQSAIFTRQVIKYSMKSISKELNESGRPHIVGRALILSADSFDERSCKDAIASGKV